MAVAKRPYVLVPHDLDLDSSSLGATIANTAAGSTGCEHDCGQAVFRKSRLGRHEMVVGAIVAHCCETKPYATCKIHSPNKSRATQRRRWCGRSGGPKNGDVHGHSHIPDGREGQAGRHERPACTRGAWRRVRGQAEDAHIRLEPRSKARPMGGSTHLHTSRLPVQSRLCMAT